MSLSTQELTEYLVCGYIREFEISSKNDIPSDIVTLCQTFYGLLIYIQSHILTNTEDKSLFIDLLSQRFDITAIQGIKLLYNSQTDGESYQDYASKCHGKPKTITMIKTEDNYIFGGYTKIPWSDKSGYKEDETAFIFLLKPESKIFNINTKQRAVYHYTETFGPWFGRHDLILWVGNTQYNKTMKCKLQDTDSYQSKTKDLCNHDPPYNCYNIVCEMFQIL